MWAAGAGRFISTVASRCCCRRRNWIAAIAEVNDLNTSQQILSKGIKSVDMRLDGRVTVEVAEVVAEADGADKKAVAKRQ